MAAGNRITHPDYPNAFGRADWRGAECWEYGGGRMALRLIGKPGEPEFLDSYDKAAQRGEYAPKPDESIIQRARASQGAGIDPFCYPPRGMSRGEAARYIGVGTTLFDEMIKDRRMPKPRQIGGRTVWDRVELDIAFSDLPHQDDRASMRKALEASLR